MEQTAISTSLGYEYRHKSGEVHRARDVLEAMGRCAVLGEMEQSEAELMLELHQIGSNIIAEATPEVEGEIELELLLNEPPSDATNASSEKESAIPHQIRQADSPLNQETGPEIIRETKVLNVNAHNTYVSESTNVEKSTGPSGKFSNDTRKNIVTRTNLDVEPPSAQLEEFSDEFTTTLWETPISVKEKEQPPESLIDPRIIEIDAHKDVKSETADTPQPLMEKIVSIPTPNIDTNSEYDKPETINLLDATDTEPVPASPPDLEIIVNGAGDNINSVHTDEAAPKTSAETNIELINIDNELEFPNQDKAHFENELPLGYEALGTNSHFEWELAVATPDVADLEDLTDTDSIQENPVKVLELSVPIDEVELAVAELAQRLEKVELGDAEEVYAILDEINKIVVENRVPHSNEILDNEIKFEGSEKANLEEKFVELFNKLGLEYSPELVESCVRLALYGDIEQLMLMAEIKEEAGPDFSTKGTHEVIKHLLVSLSTFKKKIINICRIGKSALRLYPVKWMVVYD